jgi:hypothetical protein
MTKEDIESVWADVYRMYEQSNPNIYPAAIERLRAPFDLALQALQPEVTAWIATSERGSVMHFSKADGWEVKAVSSTPQEAPK